MASFYLMLFTFVAGAVAYAFVTGSTQQHADAAGKVCPSSFTSLAPGPV